MRKLGRPLHCPNGKLSLNGITGFTYRGRPRIPVHPEKSKHALQAGTRVKPLTEVYKIALEHLHQQILPPDNMMEVALAVGRSNPLLLLLTPIHYS